MEVDSGECVDNIGALSIEVQKDNIALFQWRKIERSHATKPRISICLSCKGVRVDDRVRGNITGTNIGYVPSMDIS